jgi:hypothetical protein
VVHPPLVFPGLILRGLKEANVFIDDSAENLCDQNDQGPMLQYFFVRNLLIFVLSWSVCLKQSLTVLSNKHPSLVAKFVITDKKVL